MSASVPSPPPLWRKKAVLEEENRKLRDALTQEEHLRVEALKRIDALLRRIQEHDSVE